MKKKRKVFDQWYFFLFFWLILIDQLSKYLVRMYNPSFESSFLSLHLVTNTGAVFGWFKGYNSLFVWLSLVAIGLLLYYWYELDSISQLPAIMILSGVIGNLVDRLWLGHVVDFIDFLIWPSFNLADSYITVGVIWWFWNEVQSKR